jgi:hypothetical protein
MMDYEFITILTSLGQPYLNPLVDIGVGRLEVNIGRYHTGVHGHEGFHHTH